MNFVTLLSIFAIVLTVLAAIVSIFPALLKVSKIQSVTKTSGIIAILFLAVGISLIVSTSVVVNQAVTNPPTPTPTIDALSPVPMNFTFSTNADNLLSPPDSSAYEMEESRLIPIIQQQMQDIKTRHAGIVFAFGGSSNPSEGIQLADRFNMILSQALPSVFNHTVFRSFVDLGQTRGTISLEIYLFM